MRKMVILSLFVICMNQQIAAQKPVFNHLALSVVNLAKSNVFYKEVMKLETIPDPFKDDKHTWYSIGSHGQLHIIESSPKIIPHDRNNHVCFSVPSVSDFIKRLDSVGIKYFNAVGESQTITLRPDGVKQIYFQDPDGYWLEVNDDKS